MLLKPGKDDPLLASIIQDMTAEDESDRRVTFWYEDPETGKKYGRSLVTPKIREQLTEESMRRMVAPGIWKSVVLGRVSKNG